MVYRWTYLHGAVGVVVSMAALLCFWLATSWCSSSGLLHAVNGREHKPVKCDTSHDV